MACYQRKHPGNNFFLDIRGVNLLDVGRWDQEISKRKSKR